MNKKSGKNLEQKSLNKKTSEAKEFKEIIIFTDGSSRGNPGPGGWASVVIYPKSSGELCVDELGGSVTNTTNNRMEMMAVIGALKHFEGFYENFINVSFLIYLDSAYVLNGITKWVYGWQKNDWKTSTKEEVLNKDLWMELFNLVQDKDIKWKILPGHSGIAGNERCDVIATSFADKWHTQLYSGSLSVYPISNILDLNVVPQAVKNKKSKKSSSRFTVAYSYVSSVDGLVMTHKTWGECEKRVKGAKGARFKKVFNAEEEGSLIKEWSK